jgi:hypothetical protein
MKLEAGSLVGSRFHLLGKCSLKSGVRRVASLLCLVKKNSTSPIENSAHATGVHISQQTNKKSNEKPRVWCDYCDKPHYTHETCWKLHRKQTNWKGSHEGRFNKTPTIHEADSASFNKEQINQLLKLLQFNSSSSSAPNASLAQPGNNFMALSCHLLNYYAPWIIDSGASDHMTSLSCLFDSYSPCSGHKKIHLADGSYSSIAGKSLVNLSQNISLKI